MMGLETLGWDPFFAASFKKLKKRAYKPALIVEDNKISYQALLEDRELIEAIVSGKLWHEAENNADLPAVGDWVAVELPDDNEEAIIHHRLPRRTCLSRKIPGKGTEQQVIAANVDQVFIVTDPHQDLNLRRLERYLMIIARSGAEPVILVNKADLMDSDRQEEIETELGQLAPDVAVHFVSAHGEGGTKQIEPYLQEGKRVTFVGSSGVGKSSLLNTMWGDEVQWTGEVNDLTGKGKHTTTARTLVILPGGAQIIDNPGIREIQLWTDEQTLRERFQDIDELSARCEFHDCKHQSDRGCQLQKALEEGRLDHERYVSYLNLEDEITRLKDNQIKRQMRLARHQKRKLREKHRNYEDRREFDEEKRY